MKYWQKLVLGSMIATSLAACSSSDDDDAPLLDDGSNVPGQGIDGDGTPGNGGVPGNGGGGVTDGGNSDGGVPDGGNGGGVTDGGNGAGGVPGNGGVTDGGNGDGGVPGSDGVTDGVTDGGGEIPPAPAGTGVLPSVDNAFEAEVQDASENVDTEASVGGIPTQPKNLRIDLVSSDWAEFSWTPSNDDAGVVAYVIDRDDGVSYEISPSLPAGLSFDGGTYAEYAKYWNTTSFIDCNYTRFTFAPGSDKAIDGEANAWNCADSQPQQGETYSYTVTAVDADGNRSAPSEPLGIVYASTAAADRSLRADFIDDFDVVWNDEFDGGQVDPQRWQTELVFGSDTHINGEQQYFVPTLEGTGISYDPFEFTAGGTLKINAIRTPDVQVPFLPESCEGPDELLDADPNRDRCEFLSGALSSHDRMQFVYGYAEARINASEIRGALASFYLFFRYPGPNSPEIDILEYLGENQFGNPDAFQTLHFDDPATGITRSSPTMNHPKNADDPDDTYGAGETFYDFGVLWEPNLAVWYIDGVEVRRVSGPQIARSPLNVINYLVTGSGFAPAPDLDENGPITMEIDHIRVYQRDAFKSSLYCGVVRDDNDGTSCPTVMPVQ